MMEIRAAQSEVRRVYLGGSVGQAVSGFIWLVSVVLATWVSTRYGILVLVLGGVFIFPLTQLVIRLSGRPASLPRENPFNQLAMQVAFIVPFCLPVIGAAALYKLDWFYPAFMVVVGAHYLPFATLYGMKQYLVLGGALIGGGVAIGMLLPTIFTAGGWFTAIVLLIFAIYVWFNNRKD
jgi:hypothetical protein